MSHWHVVGKRVAQSELSEEITRWLNTKVHHGVRLFREGATRNEFLWGKAEYLVDAELSRVWMVRLFCTEYEMAARRLDHEAGGHWQLRIVAQRNHLPHGDEVEFTAEKTVLLLGEARGNAKDRDATQERRADQNSGDTDAFDPKPNRYRRARISYPRGNWQAGQICGLVTARYQPTQGGAIVCWKELRPVEPGQSSAIKPTQPKAIA